MFKSFFVALSMYSKIPVPIFEWDKKNLRYALCFFPFVGFIIGVFYILAFKACEYMQWEGFLKGSVLTAVPLFITGGIHADGFIDTMDALSSYKDKKERLEILKDPHVGAFGIIWSVIYFILYAGFSSEIREETVFVVAWGFVLSRAMSAMAVFSIKSAKHEGLLYTFSSKASKQVTRIFIILISFLSVIAAVESSLFSGIFSVFAVFIWFFMFRRISIKNFGGITGDLAGYFLQVCELLILMVSVIGGGVIVWS